MNEVARGIAEAIFADERACTEAISKDPTNPHLNGRLVGLQRARDIAESFLARSETRPDGE